MTHYIKTGDRTNIASDDAITITEHLPKGTYIVRMDKVTSQLYLASVADMTLPPKLYGFTPEYRSNRVIQTFQDRKNSTGMLLTGEKGSGKTLLTKVIARDLSEQFGTPIIMVDEPHCGPDFNKLIADIKTPSMIIFDEFEKVYREEEHQEMLLTLLDGTTSCKHLFTLTTNSDNVSSYLLNRPGRIYYTFNYSSLELSVIEEYTREKLHNMANFPGVIDHVNLYTSFNFDMLQALIEEMNRFNETADEVSSVLNVSPKNEHTSYDVFVYHKGIPVDNYYPSSFYQSPLVEDIRVTINRSSRSDDNFDGIDSMIGESGMRCGTKSLTSIESGGTLVFTFGDIEVRGIKSKPFKYNGKAF